MIWTSIEEHRSNGSDRPNSGGRRVRWLTISYDTLLAILLRRPVSRVLVAVYCREAPQDLRILRVEDGPHMDCFRLLVESETFPLVSNYQVPPDWAPVISLEHIRTGPQASAET